MATATFAKGCFRQPEMIFRAAAGVTHACVGYAGWLSVLWPNRDPAVPHLRGFAASSAHRSALFTHDDARGSTARASRDARAAELVQPVATRVEPFEIFYPAEDYHQRDLEKTPG